MKEYICVESPNEVDGGMLVREQELIRCRHCRHGVVTAMLIHKDGSIDYSYMCDRWKRPTSGDGHCDQGERIEKEDDG